MVLVIFGVLIIVFVVTRIIPADPWGPFWEATRLRRP